MGRAGKRTQPDNVRELRSGSKNAHRRINPPVAPDLADSSQVDDGPLPPEHLSPEAAEVWSQLAPTLVAHGLLTAWDVHAFGQYCELAAARTRLQAKINSRPGGILEATNREFARLRTLDMSLLRFAARFGLTPADRQQLKVERRRDSSAASRYFTAGEA